MIAIKRLISSFKLLANCTFKFSFLIIIPLPLLLSSCYFMGWHIHKVKPQEVDLTGFSLYSTFRDDFFTCSPEERVARIKNTVIGELDNDDRFYFLLLNDNEKGWDYFGLRSTPRLNIPLGSKGVVIKKGYFNHSYLYHVPDPILNGCLLRIITPNGDIFNAWYSDPCMIRSKSKKYSASN